jgi:hypothetical protein
VKPDELVVVIWHAKQVLHPANKKARHALGRDGEVHLDKI